MEMINLHNSMMKIKNNNASCLIALEDFSVDTFNGILD
jgi:hypothetical protein